MKILLVQTSFLGDTILSTPVIAAIKNLYPQADLWMMTTPLAADLVRRDPLLAGVIPLNKRAGDAGLSGLLRMSRKLKSMGFDRVYSLHRSYRTSLLLWMARIPLRIGCRDAKARFLYHRLKPRDFNQHDVMRNMSILSGEYDIEPASARMRLFPPQADEIDAQLKRTLPLPGQYAVLVPGSAWRTKMWHWEGYRKVARYLLARKIGVVLLGAASEKPVCDQVARDLDVINLAGRSTISEAVFVMQHACVAVCNDSMALHMASALKIPTAVIFCATSPKFGYGPWQNRAIVIEKNELACKPCRPHGSMRCPNGTEACMRGPDPSAVIDAVRKLLEP
jgi:heptosyltransferase-2